MASTGDMLETKPILDPSTCNKTELTKNKKHVIELSCDVYNGVVLSSTESQTLSRLNGLIGEDMVAFVKAKEEFKHKKSLPGLLYYSDVIRQSFSGNFHGKTKFLYFR